jgi:hypothetical protein
MNSGDVSAGQAGDRSTNDPEGMGGADTGAGADNLGGTETTEAGGPGEVRDETGDLRRSGPKPDTNPAP